MWTPALALPPPGVPPRLLTPPRTKPRPMTILVRLRPSGSGDAQGSSHSQEVCLIIVWTFLISAWAFWWTLTSTWFSSSRGTSGERERERENSNITRSYKNLSSNLYCCLLYELDIIMIDQSILSCRTISFVNLHFFLFYISYGTELYWVTKVSFCRVHGCWIYFSSGSMVEENYSWNTCYLYIALKKN